MCLCSVRDPSVIVHLEFNLHNEITVGVLMNKSLGAIPANYDGLGTRLPSPPGEGSGRERCVTCVYLTRLRNLLT